MLEYVLQVLSGARVALVAAPHTLLAYAGLAAHGFRKRTGQDLTEYVFALFVLVAVALAFVSLNSH